MILPTQSPLRDNKQYSQETDLLAPGGLRTCNSSKREAADTRLRQLEIIYIVQHLYEYEEKRLMHENPVTVRYPFSFREMKCLSMPLCLSLSSSLLPFLYLSFCLVSLQRINSSVNLEIILLCTMALSKTVAVHLFHVYSTLEFYVKKPQRFTQF